jgi:hypothetical protein
VGAQTNGSRAAASLLLPGHRLIVRVRVVGGRRVRRLVRVAGEGGIVKEGARPQAAWLRPASGVGRARNQSAIPLSGHYHGGVQRMSCRGISNATS